MTKIERDLLRILQPLADQAGATLSFAMGGKHPYILVGLNGQTRWVPYSTRHNIPEVTLYHTKKKLIAALAELTTGATIPHADPRKRH